MFARSITVLLMLPFLLGSTRGQSTSPPEGETSREDVAEGIERLREAFQRDISAAEGKIRPLFGELQARLERSDAPDLEGRLERLRAARVLFDERGLVPSYLGKASKEYFASVNDATRRLTQGLEEAANALEAQGDAAAADRLEQEAVARSAKVGSIAAALRFSPGGELVVMPTGEGRPGSEWLWTTNRPPLGWYRSEFRPDGWARGRAPFGNDAPNVTIRTPWTTDQIWLRTSVELPELEEDDVVFLRHRHDNSLELYTDAGPVITIPSYNNDYETHLCSTQEKAKLGEGTGTLAASCKQSGGGQAFDIGIAVLREAARDPRIDPLSRDEAAWLALRDQTDPRLRVKADLSGPKAHVGFFKAFVDRWARLEIDGDKAYLDRALGRNKLICSHPLDRKTPATLDFGELTSEGRGVLQLWVHSWPSPGSDGSLLVKVGGHVLHQQEIKATDGWQRMDLPFDRQQVVLEHHPLGWNMEYLFVDYRVVPAR